MNWIGAALGRLVGLALAHRWVFLVPVVTMMIPAAVYAVRLPDEWKATVHVQVSDFERTNAGRSLPGQGREQVHQTVATARGRLLAQTPVEAVVPVMYPGADPQDPEVLAKVRARIEYDRLTDFSFEVSITDEEPVRAAESVNTLMQAFLEEARDAPLRRVVEKREFIRDMVTESEAALKKARDAVLAYRAANAQTVPEAKPGAQDRLNTLRDTLRDQKGEVTRLRERIEDKQRDLEAARRGALRISTQRRPTAREERLRTELSGTQTLLGNVENELTDLRQRFGETHPEITGKKAQVADLKGRVARLESELGEEQERAEKAFREEQRALAEEPIQYLEREVGSYKARLEMAIGRVEQLAREEEALVDLIALMPGVEKELRRLEAVVIEADKRYERDRKDFLEADEVARYYERAQAEDVTPYTVTQWATPPIKPSGPRRMAILLVAVALGLGIGYGLVLLRQRFETTVVHSPDELRSLLPGALVVGVPLLGSGGEIAAPRRHVLREVLLGLYVAVGVGLVALLVLAHRGVIPAPEWLSGLLGCLGGWR